MSHKGFAVVRVEGLQGLEDLLNSTEGKVQRWERIGSEGFRFLVIREGVPPTYPPPVSEEAVSEPVSEEPKKKSA